MVGPRNLALQRSPIRFVWSKSRNPKIDIILDHRPDDDPNPKTPLCPCNRLQFIHKNYGNAARFVPETSHCRDRHYASFGQNREIRRSTLSLIIDRMTTPNKDSNPALATACRLYLKLMEKQRGWFQIPRVAAIANTLLLVKIRKSEDRPYP